MSKRPAKSGFEISADRHLDEVLKRLSGVPIRENGSVSWASKPLDEGTFEIIYSLTIKPPIDDYIKDGAIWHVLNECARAGNFSAKYFVQRMRVYLHDFISKEPQALVGIGQINCTLNSNFPKSMRSYNGKIEFVKNLALVDRIALERSEHFERAKLGLYDDFIYMVTRVNAANHRSAIDRAERNIKYGLGVLNLVHHGYGISKRFGYPNAPIGKFLSASSIFLVDRKSRKLGHCFSDNNYHFRFKNNFSVWYQIDKAGSAFANHYVNEIKHLDYPEKLIQSVILFQEGLEATSIDLALLKFWTGIELLCSKDEKEKSDIIIERASSIFTKPKFVAMRLRFIQEFRNRIVHKGTSGDHALLCAQWGSIFLAEIIRFCLFNRHKIRNHDQILKYMSMPIDRSNIEQIISLSKKRLASLSIKEK